jgi:UDP-N-acetylmuramate--alanine ligase
VLVSSAVPDDNEEVSSARIRGIQVVRRTDFLGWLTCGQQTIAIAGTHGKTTTTAMIALILTRAGQDPSYIVGGVSPELEANAHAGNGPHFVIEADEYEQTFLGLKPTIAVIKTVEWDHVDCYPKPDDCRTAFARFATLVPDDGLLVVCADDSGAMMMGEPRTSQGKPCISYGLREKGDWQATWEGVNSLGGSDFQVWRSGRKVGEASLRIPGQHNVLNALAALAVADYLQVPFDVAAGALQGFGGVERRFELKGQRWGVTVVDDYAHHPTEIEATLRAARQRYPGRAIWAVFQPHTYSRTLALLEGFTAGFADADHVVVTDIYAAREPDTLGISATQVVEGMAHADARHVGPLPEVSSFLLHRLRPGDVLITLGAGNGYLVGEWVLAALREREDAEKTAPTAS